ncbi:ABC transporter ATP-binding protein [bacterium SCSIO 12827]|nr:ABC transporter ATP-binding protein [bacterium SCSIO 12827]
MSERYKLEIKNVSKTFGDFQAVKSVSLDIAEGECWVFLGPSGCGKTTTLRMVAGFLAPDEGEIHIDGQCVAAGGHFIPPDKRGIAMVFQSYAVWPHKTVYDNVAYGLNLRGVSKDEERRRVHDALALVQLDGLADRYPGMLSGGQQQRVSLARAIVIEPKLLLLDEPLSNLDARLREQMRFDLKELQRTLGLTTVYVTHDQSEAMVLADQIVVMENGMIDQIGTPAEIYGRPRTRFVADFVGQSNLIAGAVVDVSDGKFTIDLDGAGRFQVPTDIAVDHRPKPGEAGFLCIRPEDMSLGRGGEATGFHGQISSRTYLGASVDYQVRVGASDDLRVSLHASNDFNTEEAVTVAFDPGKCSWLVG